MGKDQAGGGQEVRVRSSSEFSCTSVRQALQAESGAAQGPRLRAAAATWGLANYCEHIDRKGLHQRALES
eukprot:3816800-Pyramimonas_sp.AAC.1